MKRHLTAITLILLCVSFAIYISYTNRYKNVLEIYSPTKIGLDLNKNRVIDTDEIICVDNIEAFSLEPTEEFIDKYTKIFNITEKDIISLGYLAQEFAQKKIQNAEAKVKFTGKVTSECRFANITINDYDYRKTLIDSGFGISDNKLGDKKSFTQKLETARKLNLVILNHHSGKYHTLDCPYGKVAQDIVIMPEKQLPKDSKPCKICHPKQEKKPKYNLKKDKDLYNLPKVRQPALYTTSGDIETYLTDFTQQLIPNKNCSTNVCKTLVNLIDNSITRIDIAIYGYNEIPAVTNALKKAKSRGVEIRFVYDEPYNLNASYYPDNKIIKDLSSVAISDRNETSKTLSNYIMHNKFFIFDKNTVFTGSMNLSPTGMSGYDVNDIIIIKSKEIANLYTQEFEQMLNRNFHTQKVKLNQNRIFNLENSTVEVYFSPKDKSSDRIAQIIKEAKSYIYIPTFLITHSKISTELINANKRGVDVRIILDANSINTRNSKHSELRKAGIRLKTENYAGKLHAKTIIVDDEYLITGSMNFSNSGENKNDENLLIIKDSKITKLHKDFFLYLWTMIPNKYLNKNAHPEGPDSIGSCTDGVDNNFNGKIDKEETSCK